MPQNKEPNALDEVLKKLEEAEKEYSEKLKETDLEGIIKKQEAAKTETSR